MFLALFLIISIALSCWLIKIQMVVLHFYDLGKIVWKKMFTLTKESWTTSSHTNPNACTHLCKYRLFLLVHNCDHIQGRVPVLWSHLASFKSIFQENRYLYTFVASLLSSKLVIVKRLCTSLNDSGCALNHHKGSTLWSWWGEKGLLCVACLFNLGCGCREEFETPFICLSFV